MKKPLIVAVLCVSAGAGVFGYYRYVKPEPPPTPLETAATSGDVIETVQSTGTIQPMRTVEVGTQISGIISKLYVDYNSLVKKDEVVAELDPLLSQAAVDSAQASLDEATTALAQARNALATDQRNADRATEMFTQGIDTEQDKEAAVLTATQDQVTVTQDTAAVDAAKANVEQAKVNLGYCTIRSPVDGVIIARDVDEGQAVAARMSVPALYEIGTDLNKLQIQAAVDEADVAKVRPGQDAIFTVESYPGQRFHGTVSAIHLDATTTSNVVTYEAVVLVDNPNLQLRPGMTATLILQTARASNVVRVPVAALKFHPGTDMFNALHEVAPPPISLAAGENCSAQNPCTVNVSTTGTGTAPPTAEYQSVNGSIDNQFAPPSHAAIAAYVWTFADNQMQRVPIRVGITDGTWSELVSGDVKPGESLLTGMTLPQTSSAPRSMLFGRPGGPGGFGPGPGGRGGRF